MSRRGLTLIELLVVIAIIGVLLGLLVPGVQKVREAAARGECSANLRQIGLALHGFHDAHGGFPAALTRFPKPSAKSGKVAAVHWVPYILPFIDQEALYHQYHLDLMWNDPANLSAVQTPIALLVCPTAPGGRKAGQDRAITDYSATAAVIRPNPFLVSIPPGDDTFIGALGQDVNRKLTEITDGTSNTLLLAEDAGLPEEWIMGKMAGKHVANGAWADPMNVLRLTGFNPVTATTPGPCAINCYNHREIYGFHPGGANVVFADGSVRFLTPNVDLNVILALFTRRGGETIPGDIY